VTKGESHEPVCHTSRGGARPGEAL
jgi:hypothetical protein